MLLATSCPICRRPGPAPCAACTAELERAPSLPPPPGIDHCYALLSYEDGGRELVARLKYRNARSSLRWLAAALASLVVALRIDAVTWVPTTGRRRRDRGFDQAELLARQVARHLAVPCEQLLERGPGPPQTGRSAWDRRAGPALRERRRKRRQILPDHVLVVDDVITTGSSVSTAAAVLRRAGVRSVSAVAAARTPLKQARAGSN